MKTSLSAAVILAGVVFSSGLRANSITPCVANTLAAYEAMKTEAMCSVGILDYGYFAYTPTGTDLTAAQIEVTPIESGSTGGGFILSPVNPAIAPFAVGLGQTETYIIDWRFIIDPGPVASGADIGMDPPSGNVSISQAYCVDGVFGVSGACMNPGNPQLPVPSLETLTVDDTNPPSSWTAHKDFNPVDTIFASVITTINLDGSTSPAGFDSFSGSVEVTTTPEPFGWMLAAGGLALIGIRRKTRVPV